MRDTKLTRRQKKGEKRGKKDREWDRLGRRKAGRFSTGKSFADQGRSEKTQQTRREKLGQRSRRKKERRRGVFQEGRKKTGAGIDMLQGNSSVGCFLR